MKSRVGAPWRENPDAAYLPVDPDTKLRPAAGFDYAVIAFAAGIALYFVPREEPVLALILTSCLVVVGVWYGAYTYLHRFSFVFGLIAMCGVGMGYAALRTHAISPPPVDARGETRSLTGWVEGVDGTIGTERHVIRVVSWDRPDVPPLRIRVSHLSPDIRVGQAVGGEVWLRPPPGASLPGGYSPARRAYFRRIAAFGSGGRLSPIDLADPPVAIHLADARYRLAGALYDKAPARTAGMQVALLTGIRAYIDPGDRQAMRDAGLAHVLAISGLHMGMVAGGAYWIATLLLALIAPLSRRHDVRKPAAVLGIAVAMAYLVLSGASISTQRAAIMAVIVFVAVLADRRAISIRSVSVAALLTLMLHPDSLTSPGFQMSFAAVTVLVMVYGEWTAHRGARPRPRGLAKLWAWVGGLSVTSLVAGTATAGFAAHHFGRIARYGLLGNLLAMPVFTLVVMPFGVIALLTLPFGWERGPLAVMGLGIKAMLGIANWVAALPGAVNYVKSGPNWIIAALGIAIALSAIRARNWPISAVILVSVAFNWMTSSPHPVRVSERGDLAMIVDGRYRIAAEGDAYGREQFLQSHGRPVGTAADVCGDRGCTIDGRRVQIVRAPEDLVQACAFSSLVVLPDRIAGPVARRQCQKRVIDRQTLRDEGAIHLDPSRPTEWDGSRTRRLWDVN